MIVLEIEAKADGKMIRAIFARLKRVSGIEFEAAQLDAGAKGGVTQIVLR